MHHCTNIRMLYAHISGGNFAAIIYRSVVDFAWLVISVHICIPIHRPVAGMLHIKEIYALEMWYLTLQSMGCTNHKFPTIRNTECSEICYDI